MGASCLSPNHFIARCLRVGEDEHISSALFPVSGTQISSFLAPASKSLYGPNSAKVVAIRTILKTRAAIGGRSFKTENQEANEDALLQISTLMDDVSRLQERMRLGENPSVTGVRTGLEMRERVLRLMNRVVTLKKYAEQSIAMEGRIPAQVAASIKALKREHVSLENIIKLASESYPFENSPTLSSPMSGLKFGSINTVSFPNSASNPYPKSDSSTISGIPSNSPASEFGAQSFRKINRRKSPEVVKASKQVVSECIEDYEIPNDYKMTSQLSMEGSPLAEFRAEIERRVNEQLSKNKYPQEIRRAISKNTLSINESHLHLPISPRTSQLNSCENYLHQEPTIFSNPRIEEQESEIGTAEWAMDGARILSQVLNSREVLTASALHSNGNVGISQSFSSSNVRSNNHGFGSKVLTSNRSTHMIPSSNSSSISTGSQGNNYPLTDNKLERLEEEVERVKSELELIKSQNIPTQNGPNEDDSLDKNAYDEIFKRVQEPLLEARAKVVELKGEVKYRDDLLASVREEARLEQQKLMDKVQDLTSEVANRVTRTELGEAVNAAVGDLKSQLSQAQAKVSYLEAVVEDKDRILKQSKEEWGLEKVSLMGRLKAAEIWVQALQRRAQQKASDDAEMAARASLLNKDLLNFEEPKFDVEDDEDSLKDRISRIYNIKEVAEKTLEKEKVLKEVAMLQEEKHLLEVRALQAEGKVQILWNVLEKAGHQLMSLKKNLEAGDVNSGLKMVGALINQVKVTMTNARSGLEHILKDHSNIIEPVVVSDSPQIPIHDLPNKLENIQEPIPSEEIVSEIEVKNEASLQAPPDLIILPEKHITLHYQTGWEAAFLHYSADDQEWTIPPGVPMISMETDDDELKAYKVFSVLGESMEFVINDGNGVWDKAPNGNNYKIVGSGTYFLTSGVIQKVHQVESIEADETTQS